MTSFGITGNSSGDVLTLTFSGQSTPDNARTMTRRYFEAVLASKMKKVLADIRPLQGRLSDPQTYFLLRDLPVQPIPAGIRTAIVERPENRSYANFLENTGANAGVEFKCFFDAAEALAWLHAPAEGPTLLS